jgi:Na+/H+ antiporter NhaD/arsenite permease-like protein
MNVSAIILILVLFAILMGFYSQNKFDYFPIALIIAVIAIFSMVNFFNVESNEILGFINYRTLIFIFAMQIIIYFATSDKVLEYIAIRLIHITKGNNRVLFYLICIFTGIFVAFIEDLTLSLILIPLIYRTCRILKIPAGTYMMGMTITINIGAILTPVSSLKNLIIGQEFAWGFKEYFVNMGPLFLIILILTVLFLDIFILKKEEKPTERNKKLLLELGDPRLVIVNKKHFVITAITLIATFICMGFGLEPAIVTVISASLLIIFHYKKTKFSDIQNAIPLRLIILFAILFILSNSLAHFGFSSFIFTILSNATNNNIYLSILLILVISSVLSAFLAGTPVTIILLPIFSEIILISPIPNPIIIAFIGGVNLAGNFLPQGSACDMLTLSLAKKYNVKNLNYKRLLKTGALFSTFHFLAILIYTMIYALILS